MTSKNADFTGQKIAVADAVSVSVFEVWGLVARQERLTRDMDDLKTPASTAVAATTAYTPGWMFQETGMDIMRFTPTMAPKDAPTCQHSGTLDKLDAGVVWR